MAFWTRFLDEMARHRYNVLSLWSPQPVPVAGRRRPGSRTAALADVKRKTGAMFDATNRGRHVFDPAWPLETVKDMSIDEKIAFWRRGDGVPARDRGIDVSSSPGTFSSYGTEGSGNGLTIDPRNRGDEGLLPQVRPRAVQHVSAAGTAMGVTSGENMGPLNDAGKEDGFGTRTATV